MSIEQFTLALEDKQQQPKLEGRRKMQELNLPKLLAELQELAGDFPVKVKLDKKLRAMVASRDTDNLCLISFNPKKIKTQRQLENCLDFARTAVSW